MQNEALPRIMLVDMNSFFASVEQQANPSLRGKPVGVCARLASTSDSESRRASLHPTSCLIAASKEAKALGIKTGILTYQAKKIYPKIILVQAEPAKYRQVNQEINRIFAEYTDVVESYSIDESFLDLRQSKLNPLFAGVQIKQRIKSEVGEWLTCSVGIAPNKFMAKLAADLQKPDGLSLVWRSQLAEIYKDKKLTDLWGIARGWERRLGKLGITKPGQLLGYPMQNLIAVFGKPGFWLWQRVNGLEEPEFSGGEVDPKSFGHSWVLNFRSTDKEQLKKVILRLAEKAARRMRRAELCAGGIYLSISLADGSFLHRGQKLGFCINTGIELYEQAMKLWRHWQLGSPAVHIAVGFNYLSPQARQLNLFEDKSLALNPVLDLINDKYGEFTIRSGLLARTADFAPDAIAFGK